MKSIIFILFIWYLLNLELGKALMAYALTQVLPDA